MSEIIYEIIKDSDGVDCYIKRGEVVRCKDCKQSDVYQSDSRGTTAMYCKAFTLHRMVAEDDYCSYGERREP